MILDTTHTNKENKLLINDLVGKPFSLLESIKMRGTGSKRMIINEVSSNLQVYLNANSDINYANIELRKNGVVVYINKGLRCFSWPIPYYHLVLYKTSGLSIHAQGHFIKFKNNKMFKENKLFFSKLLDKKIKFDEQYDFQHL